MRAPKLLPMATGTTAQGYGSLAKALHWLTVLLIAAQFVVGYLMDWDDKGGDRDAHAVVAMAADDPEEKERKEQQEREEERREEAEEAEEDAAEAAEDNALLPLHIGLGVSILLMGIVRVLRRRYDGLPAWAEQLTPSQRHLATWTERVLLTLLFVIPASGIALVLSSDDDLTPLHVGAHIAFFIALIAHVGLAVTKGTIRRML